MRTTILNDIEVSVEPRIAVVGVGGAGCNVASDMYWSYCSVDTIAINTDKAALAETNADKKLYICKAVTKGEGARGDAGIGRQCAKIHEEEIRDALRGHDAVFIIAGMGGGTGSGAAAIVADIAQSLNVITFTIAVNPFSFENARTATAAEGLRHLKAVCPLTVTVENDLVLKQMPDATLTEAFKAVNSSIIAFVEKQKESITKSFFDAMKDIEVPDTRDRPVPDMKIRFGMNA
jgi:cell division protein FtsZ